MAIDQEPDLSSLSRSLDTLYSDLETTLPALLGLSPAQQREHLVFAEDPEVLQELGSLCVKPDERATVVTFEAYHALVSVPNERGGIAYTEPGLMVTPTVKVVGHRPNGISFRAEELLLNYANNNRGLSPRTVECIARRALGTPMQPWKVQTLVDIFHS